MGIELGGDRAGEEWGRAERRGGGGGDVMRGGEGFISGHKILHINTKISIYPDGKYFRISHFDKFAELRV